MLPHTGDRALPGPVWPCSVDSSRRDECHVANKLSILDFLPSANVAVKGRIKKRKENHT